MKIKYKTIRFVYNLPYIGSTGNPSVKPYNTIWSQKVREDMGYDFGRWGSFGWIPVGDPKPVKINQDSDQIAKYASRYPLYDVDELYNNRSLVLTNTKEK